MWLLQTLALTILLPWSAQAMKRIKCKPDRSKLDDATVAKFRAMWEERWFYDTSKFPKFKLTCAQQRWWDSLRDYFPPGRISASGGNVDQTERTIEVQLNAWEEAWFDPSTPGSCVTKSQKDKCENTTSNTGRKKRDAPTTTKPVPTLDPKELELIKNASKLFGDSWLYADPDKFPATNLTAAQKLYLDGIKIKVKDKKKDKDKKKPGRNCVIIKLPAWTRMEWRRMAKQMRKSFVESIKKLASFYPDPKRNISGYDIFVKMHRVKNSPGAQRGASLLVWHREFLWRFSNALRRVGYPGEIPYWDPTLDIDLPDPSCSALWTKENLGNNTGDVGEPFQFLKPINECGRKLFRKAFKGKKAKKLLFSRKKVENVMAKACYNDLTWGWDPEFESCYNDVHASFGPMRDVQMADPNCAPSDPAFWLLLAFIDMVWEKYRIYKQGKNMRETEYPKQKLGKLPAAMAWYSDMRPFGNMPNIQGLSDMYTSYYYSYEDQASFIECKSNEDCDRENTGLLWCETKTKRCIAKINMGCACKKDWPNQQCWCPTGKPECRRCLCKCS